MEAKAQKGELPRKPAAAATADLERGKREAAGRHTVAVILRPSG